jgi:ubiquinone/menaquinone biosynthesis C-methylase UbiE
MNPLRKFLAKTTATQLIRVSFSRPALLETPAFLTLMNRVFSAMAPGYDRLWQKMGTEAEVLGPLEAGLSRVAPPPDRVLDLACGTGLATFHVHRVFPKARMVAADLSERMVRILRRKAEESDGGPVHALCSHSGALPFRAGRFDLVLTQNAPPYLEEMVRVLRPGGSLLLAYSFVVPGAVRGVIRRRFAGLGLEELEIATAGHGIAVTARRPRGELR